jgi:hypothetical protein
MSVQSNSREHQRAGRGKRTGNMIRVPESTHDILRDLSIETGQSMQELLVEAVDAMRRRRMLEMTNAAYAALRDDPDAWREELAERREWDTTLVDGLEEA